MFIVSNHLQTVKFPIRSTHIVRINIAWIKDKEELTQIITGVRGHKVLLDFPSGRFKPPQSELTLEEVMEVAKKFIYVKYLAWSNVEEKSQLIELRNKIDGLKVTLVPKIETLKGVENLASICEGITKIAMLDKEDLYLNLEKNNDLYNMAVEQVRKTASEHKINLLELVGVIFA